jgi:type II secretory pathway pseudopilin PulG
MLMPFRRIRTEAGFGVIELLIALTILTFAVGALLALFASSLVVLNHSGREGTAVSLADRQVEVYRAMSFNCIPDPSDFPPSSPPTGCGTYTGFPNPYDDDQVTTAAESPDQNAYRVTTEVTDVSGSGSATEIKVTVALASGGPALANATSYFSTAGTAGS